MNLKKIRIDRSLLGDILRIGFPAGVPRRTIQDIEKNDTCKVETAIKLADALEVTLDELCR